MSGTALVVGASGFLGRAVVARLDRAGWDAVGTYCSSPPRSVDSALSATVQYDFWTDDLRERIAAHDVDAVVFAAAVEYGGDADTGDSDVDAAFAARAARVARACRDRRLVYVSSAAVFDGTGGRYDESAPRSPRDAYGRRLVSAEDAVDGVCDDAVVLRTSYLFGVSAGALDGRLAATREALARGESVTYFEDMHKSPLAVTEAADAVAALLDADATGVVHAPAPRTSVYAFHCDAMAALDLDPDPIERERIPAEMDVAPDRSLASDRFESLVGFRPSAVRPAMGEMADDALRER